MIEVTLINVETGETKIVPGPTGNFSHPWKIQGIRNTGGANPVKAKAAVWAQKFGLPVADFLDAARWLLDKDCPFCQLGTQVLRAVEALGTEKAEAAIVEILAAKESGDHARLTEIRKSLWPSDQPT